MSVPIYDVCSADAAVVSLLGSNPMRLYEFGIAPDGVRPPYVVWQDVSGHPENYLAQRPDIDHYRIQIDVYAADAIVAKKVKEAVQTAIELQCNILSYNGSFREKDTRLYRISFDANWLVSRC